MAFYYYIPGVNILWMFIKPYIDIYIEPDMFICMLVKYKSNKTLLNCIYRYTF